MNNGVVSKKSRVATKEREASAVLYKKGKSVAQKFNNRKQ